MIKFVRTTNACGLTQAEVNALPFDWGIVHMLRDEPMTLDDVVAKARECNENHMYGFDTFDTNHVTIAYSLVRLCEVGMAAAELPQVPEVSE